MIICWVCHQSVFDTVPIYWYRYTIMWVLVERTFRLATRFRQGHCQHKMYHNGKDNTLRGTDSHKHPQLRHVHLTSATPHTKWNLNPLQPLTNPLSHTHAHICAWKHVLQNEKQLQHASSKMMMRVEGGMALSQTLHDPSPSSARRSRHSPQYMVNTVF